MNVAIFGAGIWGASSAFYLRRKGHHVQLFDMWGPGNVISGSGGHSRIIRLVYGADQIYVDLTYRSFELWKEIFQERLVEFYRETGMLWLFPTEDAKYVEDSATRIHDLGHRIDEIDLLAFTRKYPQISSEKIGKVFYEHKAGILAASRCCEAMVEKFIALGGHYQQGCVSVSDLNTAEVCVDGKPVHADRFIFATGPWTRKIFPNTLGDCSYVSKQDIYHFAIPNHHMKSFSPPNLPAWLEYDPDSLLFYGMPMHMGKGFKVAYDNRSEEFDPDWQDRVINHQRLKDARAFLSKRFPALAASPLSYSEVCQYDNSLDGHFIIDRHPDQAKFILMCGSSGHGFKMGPAIGELVCRHLDDNHPLPDQFGLNRFEKRSEIQSQFLPKGL